jgi:hypothetical protein
MSAKKISAARRSNYAGPRRSIPPLQKLKRELKASLEREKQLVESLMNDAKIRRSIERTLGLPSTPMSVWTDNDHSWPYTELAPNHLPRWVDLTEYMKLFLAWDVGIEFGICYPFASHIDPSLLTKWTGGRGILANVEQRLRRQLKARGISNLPYCYIMEARSKWGKSKTRLHLHGFALCESSLDATSLLVALEKAFNPDLKRIGRQRDIWIRPADSEKEEFQPRERYVSYITKNADRWDQRLGKRRVFLSHSLIDLAKIAWAARREEPVKAE